jgi:uncharacterized membrane protein
MNATSPLPRDRRAQFTDPPARRTPVPFVVMCSAALLFLTALVIVGTRDAAPAAAVESASATTDVVLPAAGLDDGQARFYRYQTSLGREVRFFLIKSVDGVIRAAFDSCDICFRDRRGYRQAGDVMVCNKCGQTFPSAQINVLRGGCNPVPVERHVEGGQVVVRAASLEQGAAYF